MSTLLRCGPSATLIDNDLLGLAVSVSNFKNEVPRLKVLVLSKVVLQELPVVSSVVTTRGCKGIRQTCRCLGVAVSGQRAECPALSKAQDTCQTCDISLLLARALAGDAPALARGSRRVPLTICAGTRARARAVSRWAPQNS